MKYFTHKVTLGLVLLTLIIAGCGDSDINGNQVPAEFSVETPATPGGIAGVLTDVEAYGQGAGTDFDGTVDQVSDLEALVGDAWGEADFGLHRGHAPIENVLITFLGVSNEGMHELMDNDGMNLAAVAESQEVSADDLVETLTNSYRHFVAEGVENGVITEGEADAWIDQIRTEFHNRVYWEG